MILGTVALVTGAGKGIGRAVALRLARDGYNIALNDIRRHEGLSDVRAEIKATGRDVIECIADVSKEREVKEMIDTTVKELGGLDVMVANAGIGQTKRLLDTTLEDWDQIFDINGKGVFLCYKYAAKRMIEQGRGGRIIGASSAAGKQGFGLISLYSATKFTVRALTQGAAIELKPHGITVNAYAPGLIQTSLLDRTREEFKDLGTVLPGGLESGSPEEVAALVSYLASKEARYVTGQSISINGGTYFD